MQEQDLPIFVFIVGQKGLIWNDFDLTRHPTQSNLIGFG